MQGDLISRSALLTKLNDTGVQITFDLPVEEILGEDVDMADFTMLVQDAIQAYRKMVIDVIQNQPTAYDVEKVAEQLRNIKDLHEGLSKSEKLSKEDKHIHSLCHGLCVKVIDIVCKGGKE